MGKYMKKCKRSAILPVVAIIIAATAIVFNNSGLLANAITPFQLWQQQQQQLQQFQPQPRPQQQSPDQNQQLLQQWEQQRQQQQLYQQEPQFATPQQQQQLQQQAPQQQQQQLSTSNTAVGKFLQAIMRNGGDQQALVNMYKPYMKAGDIVAMFPNTNNLNYAKQLIASSTTTGASYLGVQYFSLADIKANAPTLKSKGVSIVGYDLEKVYSPASDLANPVASMTTASNIAHQYGLKLECVPANIDNINQYMSSFAKVSDIFQIQSEWIANNPTKFSNYIHNLVPKLRTAHPGMPIIAELTTNLGTTLDQMKQDTISTSDVIDGYTSWYNNDQAGRTKLTSYMNWFVQQYG
jgi:hypothetical protein